MDDVFLMDHENRMNSRCDLMNKIFLPGRVKSLLEARKTEKKNIGNFNVKCIAEKEGEV